MGALMGKCCLSITAVGGLGKRSCAEITSRAQRAMVIRCRVTASKENIWGILLHDTRKASQRPQIHTSGRRGTTKKTERHQKKAHNDYGDEIHKILAPCASSIITVLMQIYTRQPRKTLLPATVGSGLPGQRALFAAPVSLASSLAELRC